MKPNDYRQSTRQAIVLATLLGIGFEILIYLPRLAPLWQVESWVLQQIPSIVWRDFFYIMISHCLSWAVFGFIIYVISCGLGLGSRRLRRRQFGLTLWVWLLAYGTVLLSTGIFFPRSWFANLSTPLGSWAWPLLLIMLCLWLSLLSLSILGSLRQWRQSRKPLLILILMSLGLIWSEQLSTPQSKTPIKPNIIIIGLDSLRPELTSDLPNLNKFLQGAVNFNQAITPLARTFPSWVSSLTGLTPENSGATHDLARLTLEQKQASVAYDFNQEGYKTLYATDEVRFSNIDKTYGFNKIISPPMGLSDFLLGTFYDFPWVQLWSQTRLGSILFPWHHSNRANITSYYPRQFDNRLQRELPSDTPMFLVVHYCLGHWPYTWAPNKTENLEKQYLNSLKAMDKQFGKLLKQLTQRGLLNNAWVFVLSDHGENLDPVKPLGHGTDIHTPAQYKILLAARAFGLQKNIIKTYNFPVSLIDIKPTLINLLNWDKDFKTDGISLAKYLTHPTPAPHQRCLTTETGFSPEVLLEKSLSEADLLTFGAKHYGIDPKTGRVYLATEVKKSRKCVPDLTPGG